MKRRNDNWIRCKECGHKLARLEKSHSNCPVEIEFKCHSCKALNVWKAGVFWKPSRSPFPEP